MCKIGVVASTVGEPTDVETWMAHACLIGFSTIFQVAEGASPDEYTIIKDKALSLDAELEWLLECETDEFLWCSTNSLAEFLASVPADVGTIVVPKFAFSANHMDQAPGAHVFERFTRCRPISPSKALPLATLSRISALRAGSESVDKVLPNMDVYGKKAADQVLTWEAFWQKQPLVLAKLVPLPSPVLQEGVECVGGEACDIDTRMAKYVATAAPSPELSQKTIDICLAGLIARSYERTLAVMKRTLVAPAIAAGCIVRVHVFTIDPGMNKVDGRLVSTSKAIAHAQTVFGPLATVRTVQQDDLDALARSFEWEQALRWLRVPTTAGKPDLARERRVPYIKNMYRQLAIERLASLHLAHTAAERCVVVAPDIVVGLNSGDFVKAVDALSEKTLLVPRGSSLDGKFGIINGFVAGHPSAVSRFLLREKVIAFSNNERIPRPVVGWLNWERMCALCAKREVLQLSPFPVHITKVRANGATKKAWGCRPR
jgi:hypothetical protein